MNPGINDLIHRSQNEPFYQSNIKLLAHATIALSQFNNLRDQLVIHFGHGLDLLFNDSMFLAGFRLVYDRHVSITLKCFQMASNQIPKLINRGIGPVHFLSKCVKYLLCLMAEKMDKDIIFVFKIKVHGAVGNPGLPGDLRYGRLVEAFIGEKFYGSFQDPMIFIIVFFLPADGLPPDHLHKVNECSFIYQATADCVKKNLSKHRVVVWICGMDVRDRSLQVDRKGVKRILYVTARS